MISPVVRFLGTPRILLGIRLDQHARTSKPYRVAIKFLGKSPAVSTLALSFDVLGLFDDRELASEFRQALSLLSELG